MGLSEFLFRFLEEKSFAKILFIFEGSSKGHRDMHKLGKGALEMFMIIAVLLFKVITYSVIKNSAVA